MVFYAIILALGVIAMAVFLKYRAKENSVRACLLKALTSGLFVSCGAVAAFTKLGSEQIGFSLFVLVGLVFGLMGDIWLDLKWVYRNDNDIFTFSGFGAFLIGHLIYIAGLFKYFADFSKVIYIIVPVAIAAVAAIGIIALEKPMKMVYGKFKAITAVYAFILMSMTFISGSLAIMNGFKVWTVNLMFIGGVFFLISDLILSGTYFGEGKDRPVDVITNHVTYYIAQFVIASALLFLA